MQGLSTNIVTSDILLLLWLLWGIFIVHKLKLREQFMDTQIEVVLYYFIIQSQIIINVTFVDF